MRTIAIINQKGGCGKTTTAINLAGVFAQSNLRTLLVDLDPQSHCAAGLAIPETRIDVQIGDAMLAGPEKAIDWTRLLWRVGRNLDLAPSTVRLAGLEAARGGLIGQERAEHRLSDVLVRLADQYDVCLVDCAPSIGLLTYNALLAATEVLIPVETAFFALQGSTKQVSTIKSIARKLGTAPPYRLIATMHDSASPLAADVLEELKRRFGERLSPMVVRLDPRLREAASFGQPIIDYAPDAPGAEDYRALARWLLDHKLARPAPMEPEAEPPTASPVCVVGGAGDGLLAGPSAAPAAIRLEETESAASTAVAEARSRAEEVQTLAARLATRTARGASPGVEEAGGGAAVAVERALAGVLGARATSQGVLFVQPAALGSSLAVAGDFNGWSAETHAMRLNPSLNVYERLIALPPGRHHYRLVVDGRWIPDPYNPVESPNPFGGVNSVVTVSEPATVRS